MSESISLRYIRSYDVDKDLNSQRGDVCACGRSFRNDADGFYAHARQCAVVLALIPNLDVWQVAHSPTTTPDQPE